jgi:hypothetical protein
MPLDLCVVPGCGRDITDPDVTFCLCAAHWHDYLTPKKRQAIRLAYTRWTAGRTTLRERQRAVNDALKYLANLSR